MNGRTISASPFPRKGVTAVRWRCQLHYGDLLPPWGGPAEAVGTIPPSPFPRKGVTAVRWLRQLHYGDLLPPWGGPAEAA